MTKKIPAARVVLARGDRGEERGRQVTRLGSSCIR